jgi:cytoskeleton protein RodZ
MTDKTIEQDQEQAKPNLGYILVKGREAANISIASLASQLNLDESQLIDLENNQYENLGPEIFVKGYIKSYCKLLDLDENDVMQSYQSSTHNSKEKEMQSFSNRFEKETHDSRLMIVSYIVLSIVLGSSGILWWQNQNSKDEAVINSPEVDMNLNTEEVMDAASVTIEPKLTSIVEQSNVIATKEEITAVKEHNPVMDFKIAKVSTPATDSISEEKKDESISEIVPETAITTEQVKQEEVINELIVSKIIMRFSGDSWVEIFDATSERVAFGVKKSGYVMTVNGVAPFSVVLGKHQLVEIELDGETVDTSSFPTNRLAKFQLPLSL